MHHWFTDSSKPFHRFPYMELRFERVMGASEFMALERKYHWVVSYGKLKICEVREQALLGHGDIATMKHKKINFVKEEDI